MGGHMASNLVKAGFPVSVFDISKESVSHLVAKGATASSDLAGLARCDVIVTMLPASPHVRSVYTDPETGLLARVRPGTLLIDSSTIDPATAKEVAAQAQLRGAAMVDAPVSGGVGGALNGTLTFMVGGAPEAFQRALPVLQAMGKSIVLCGASGSGQIAKVCNNLVLGISMAAVSEGMSLGVKLGMDPKVLAGIINSSSGRCWSSDTYNPCPGVMPSVPASNHYKGGFGVDLMRKDLGLALQAARDSGSALPLGETTEKLYGEISREGNGKKDFAYIYQHISKIGNKQA